MSEEMISKLKEMGFNLFPLQPNSKKPIAGVNWKQYQDEKYDGIFPPSCNIAVVMGNTSTNLFVVDIDDESLYKEFDFDTFTVKTGRGYHVYFSYHGFPPPTMRVDDKRGRHIDVQSKGTYVLAPSSVHPETGKTYDIIKDVPVMDISIPTLKDKLEKMGFKTEQKPIEEISQGLKEGGRNAGTFKYACHLIRQGVFGEALNLEIEKLNQRHEPPLPQSEIELIISQASKAESRSVLKHINDAKSVVEQLRSKPKKVTMQEITPALENKPIEFDCMIIGVGERLTYTIEATFVCPICFATKDVKSDDLHQLTAPYCSKNKCMYEIDETSKTTGYIQQVRIQEFLEESRNSSPIEFDAEIVDENVGEAFIGDHKTLIAKFRSVSIPHKKYNQIVFQILEMNDMEQQVGCLPDDEELEKWKSTPDFFEMVSASILPDILINPKIIQTIILWACGGNTLNGKRDLIHTGLLGDAQTGKSELLLRMHKLLIGSGYTVGRNVSGAGLTIGMAKMYNGTMIPKAGWFPSHTGHHCIYDEIDKSSKDTQDACLEVMEQQTTSQAKTGTGVGLTLPAKCPLLIAGNPKNGKFNPKYGSVMDNFDMEVPFISRFDVLWMMRDENDPETDKQIRKFIRTYQNRHNDYMTIEELQRYFTYIQSQTATVSEQMRDKIDELHEKMRVLNTGGSLPIGWRQYHGLYRLLTASAKAHLRTEVTDEDFELVEGIIRDSYKTMRLDLDTGEVKDPYIKKGDRKKLTIDETWSECMDSELDNTVDRDDFEKALSKKDGFNALDVTLLFEKMIKSGSIELNDELERYKKVK